MTPDPPPTDAPPADEDGNADDAPASKASQRDAPGDESSQAEGSDPFDPAPPNVLRNTRRILAQKQDAVHRLDPDHWSVYSLHTPSRRVNVIRKGDVYRCRSDKKNRQDQPCSHILAVLVFEGLAQLPNSAGSVWRKGREKRNQAAEAAAWRRVPTRVPFLLARLLNQGLPVLARPAPALRDPLGRGRPRKPLYPQVYQAVMRVAFRVNLHASIGVLGATDHRAHNPYGSCGIATLSRFLSNPKTTPILEKLLALSTWPAKPYESLFHPDGTGLTEQRFSAYFDERYRKRKKGRKGQEAPDAGAAAGEAATAEGTGSAEHGKAGADGKPRLHHWTYAEMLWTYRYTLIAAVYTQQGPFGEAPWLLPLLDRARLVFDIGEMGGDKAYQAGYVFEYARQYGIDAQIKFKQNVKSPQTYARLNAMRKTFREYERDPEGYKAKANRRNNAETGNHAFKAILGDQIYSKSAVAQRNEILCMAIAYNLTRLTFLEVERGIEADFVGGAEVLRLAAWESLEALQTRYRVDGKPRAEWAEPGTSKKGEEPGEAGVA